MFSLNSIQMWPILIQLNPRYQFPETDLKIPLVSSANSFHAEKMRNLRW